MEGKCGSCVWWQPYPFMTIGACQLITDASELASFGPCDRNPGDCAFETDQMFGCVLWQRKESA